MSQFNWIKGDGLNGLEFGPNHPLHSSCVQACFEMCKKRVEQGSIECPLVCRRRDVLLNHVDFFLFVWFVSLSIALALSYPRMPTSPPLGQILIDQSLHKLNQMVAMVVTTGSFHSLLVFFLFFIYIFLVGQDFINQKQEKPHEIQRVRLQLQPNQTIQKKKKKKYMTPCSALSNKAKQKKIQLVKTLQSLKNMKKTKQNIFTEENKSNFHV